MARLQACDHAKIPGLGSESMGVVNINIPSMHQEREAAGCKPQLDQKDYVCKSLNLNEVASVCQAR
jgi:hypothetical protein